MRYSAWFACGQGCDERYRWDEVVTKCRRCGGLLEVEHDLEALRARSAAAWMKLFDDRYMRTHFPFGSGVWGKKEWVLPEIDDESIVSIYEGGTNLFWADRFGKELGLADLWIKQCGVSHTGSFKDLGMTVLVSVVNHIRRRGRPIRAVACASTGDTSAALSAYGAAAGIPVVVLLPRDRVTIAQLLQPLANGALVLALETDFDGCMAIVQRLAEEEGVYLANSMNALRLEGQKTVAIEMTQQFDWEVPDVVVVPGGNLGNVHAIGQGFLLMRALGLVQRLPRLVCVQAEAANPLYLSYEQEFRSFRPIRAGETVATAIRIGNPVSAPRAIRTLREMNGTVLQASEEQIAEATARADRTGLFACPHTGVALAGLLQLVERGEIPRQARVVVVSTAHGLKFVDFKERYHRGALEGVTPSFANRPLELPPDYDRVCQVLRERFGPSA